MRKLLAAAAGVMFALSLTACFAGSMGVKTNVISAANPSGFHVSSNTGVTTVGPAAFNAGCSAKLGTADVLECKWYFQVRLADAQNVDDVVPIGADSDPAKAYPENKAGTGPTQSFAAIESGTKLHLQPWTDYQTQGCAWVRLSSAPSTWRGPFCGGKDTNGDGKVDVGTWSDAWSTQPDPSGFNPERGNGMPLHWAGTAERAVDFGNCLNGSAWQAPYAKIAQWVVAGKYRARLTNCQNAAQDVWVYDQDDGDTGILGQANYYWDGVGHFRNDDPYKPTIELNDYYAGVDPNINTEVMIHEAGHVAGLAHRRNTVMNAVGFGTHTAVDAPNLATLGFLYSHADAAGSSAPAARLDASSARDPALKSLLSRGVGARSVRRTGARETRTQVNAGHGLIQMIDTIYANQPAASRDVARQAVAVAKKP
jgi:hypothetical protein